MSDKSNSPSPMKGSRSGPSKEHQDRLGKKAIAIFGTPSMDVVDGTVKGKNQHDGSGRKGK